MTYNALQVILVSYLRDKNVRCDKQKGHEAVKQTQGVM